MALVTPQALADEYGIKFYETSAKNNINVEKAFTEMARDVMKRLQEQVIAQKRALVISRANI